MATDSAGIGPYSQVQESARVQSCDGPENPLRAARGAPVSIPHGSAPTSRVPGAGTRIASDGAVTPGPDGSETRPTYSDAERSLLIEDAWHRMAFATTLGSRLIWARRMVAIRREALT